MNKTPRSYARPYSKALHRKLEKALKMIKKGNRVMGKRQSLDGQFVRIGDVPTDKLLFRKFPIPVLPQKKH